MTMSATERFSLSSQYAGELRERATGAEKRLCWILDKEQISYVFQSNACDLKTGVFYIADFRIRRLPSARPRGLSRRYWERDDRKLFVEVDGGYHEERQAYDAKRTCWFEAHRNAVILRFTNDDVFSRPEIIIAAINQYCPARKTKTISATRPYRKKRSSRRPHVSVKKDYRQ
mgnify:CR=1 FL=1